MYFVIGADQLDDHPSLAAQMFRLRAKVFRDELGWVDCAGEEERDVFDTLSPVYIMHTDATATRLYAAARLMPTMGPTLLQSVFADTIPDAAIAAPNVWEITRLVVDDRKLAADGVVQSRLAILSRMLIAGMEFGIAHGIDTFLANFDPVRLRAFRRLGARFDVMGESELHSVPVYLGLIEATEDALAALKSRHRVAGPVLCATPRPWPPVRVPGAVSIAA